VDNTKKLPTVFSVCTGYGGLERGIELVIGPTQPLAYVEIEAFAIANLVNKMELYQMVPVPIWTNLKTFDARPFQGCVDIFTGGYPCQPFSCAGNRLGEEDPRHLWPYIRNIVSIIKPRWVFFENVEGHITKGIVQVLADLEELGYRVEVGLFSAEEVGAPHRRKRVFILGHAKHDGLLTTKDRRSTCEEQEKGRMQEPEGRCCEELANNKSSGTSEDNGGLRERSCGTCGRERPDKEKLANNNSDRGEIPYQRGLTSQQEFNCNGEERRTRWPARPGEPQYDWEEPRVVAESNTWGSFRRDSYEPEQVREMGQCSVERETRYDGSERKTQPKLDRVPDGLTDRVDRLRLLGNGVVPQTAAKAFYTLYTKLW
jgi:DNA (cytosine-5)-methyltransferase 1